MEAVVRTSDLADELGVTPETVSRWIREGRIPGAFRRRGRWCIPYEDAEAFLGDLVEKDEPEDYDEEAWQER